MGTNRRPRPLPPRRLTVMHTLRNAGFLVVVVFVGLTIGAVGYRHTVGLAWLDAYLNASMILTGMGPIAPLRTSAAKLFGIFYSVFSGVLFLTTVAVLLAPLTTRILHRLHLDLYGNGD